jgi:hypothetical protein
MMEKKAVVRLVILLTLAFAGRAFAQQTIEPPEVTVTPNERVQQAFKALEEQQAAMARRKAFNGPFMSAYGDMSQFACTAVGPDGWCVNPFSAMAKE